MYDSLAARTASPESRRLSMHTAGMQHLPCQAAQLNKLMVFMAKSVKLLGVNATGFQRCHWPAAGAGGQLGGFEIDLVAGLG